MKRFGALLVFKPGTSRAEVEAALLRIEDVLDPNYLPTSHDYRRINGIRGLDKYVVARDGEHLLARVEKYDDEHGSPVFYIP